MVSEKLIWTTMNRQLINRIEFGLNTTPNTNQSDLSVNLLDFHNICGNRNFSNHNYVITYWWSDVGLCTMIYNFMHNMERCFPLWMNKQTNKICTRVFSRFVWVFNPKNQTFTSSVTKFALWITASVDTRYNINHENMTNKYISCICFKTYK